MRIDICATFDTFGVDEHGFNLIYLAADDGNMSTSVARVGGAGGVYVMYDLEMRKISISTCFGTTAVADDGSVGGAIDQKFALTSEGELVALLVADRDFGGSYRVHKDA